MRPQDIVNSRKDWSEEFNEVIKEGVIKLNKGPERQRVSPTYRFTSDDLLMASYIDFLICDICGLYNFVTEFLGILLKS